jgi:hypothetical protein
MSYEALKSQFEWLINGGSITENMNDNLGNQLQALEEFLR